MPTPNTQPQRKDSTFPWKTPMLFVSSVPSKAQHGNGVAQLHALIVLTCFVSITWLCLLRLLLLLLGTNPSRHHSCSQWCLPLKITWTISGHCLRILWLKLWFSSHPHEPSIPSTWPGTQFPPTCIAWAPFFPSDVGSAINDLKNRMPPVLSGHVVSVFREYQFKFKKPT